VLVKIRRVTACCFQDRAADMASTGGRTTSRRQEDEDHGVEDLLQNLHLTTEEEEMVEFSDDDGRDETEEGEWALIGKVLSPATLHVNTILGALKPAWGNTYGLKLCSVGEKGLFVAEFYSPVDRDRALEGSPWMDGKHAVILQMYDEHLKPTDICFDRMELWVPGSYLEPTTRVDERIQGFSCNESSRRCCQTGC
jgi:hypothetical protein